MAKKNGKKGSKSVSKSKKTQSSTSTSSKPKRSVKNTKGLRRYARIIKILGGGKKRSLKEYRQLQQEAKAIYPNFKNVAPSNIRKNAVLSAKPKTEESGVKIKASEIPRVELEMERDWWMIGQDIYDLHNAYPEVRLVVQSPQNQIIIESDEVLEPSYSGSRLAEFVELLRIEFDDASGITFTGQATLDKKGEKEFAFFGTSGLPFPSKVEPPKKLPPKTEKEIERRRKREEKRKEDAKKKQQELSDIKKGTKPKVRDKKERITDKQSEQLTKQLELLERLFDKGVLDAKELKTKMDDVLSKYRKGGIV